MDKVIEGIRQVDSNNIDMGGSWYCFAEDIADAIGLAIPEARNLLAKAERAGLVKGTVLRCEGRGRKGTRQTYTKKTYRVVK